MPTFVERYLLFVIAPVGLALGFAGYNAGWSYWATTVPIGLAILFLFYGIQISWRFALVLRLNKLDYTVTKSGDGWSASKSGQDISARSLTALVQSAEETQIRRDERKAVERQFTGWTPPSGMAND